MKMTNQFLAGTALCLFMTAPLAARAETSGLGAAGMPVNGPQMLLAQAENPGEAEPAPADGAEGGADCPPGSVPGGDGCVALEDASPAEEAPPEEAPSEAAPPEDAPAGEALPQEAPADAAPIEEAPAEEAPPEDAPAEAAPPEEAPAEEAPAESAPASEQPAEPQTDAPAEPEAQAPAEEAPDADAPAEPTMEAPAEESPGAGEPADGAGTDGGEPASEAAPAPQDDAADTPSEEPATEQAPADAEGGEDAPADAGEAPGEDGTADGGCPAGTEMSQDGGGCVVIDEDVPAQEAPAEDEPADEAAPDEEPSAPADTEDGQADTDAGTDTETDADAQADGEEVLPENAAPVLDSQKDGSADPEATDEGAMEGEEQPVEGEPMDDPDAAAEEQPAEDGQQPAEGGQQADEAPVPGSDEQGQETRIDSQQLQEEIRAMVEEEGQRIELGQSVEDRRVRRAQLYQRRDDATVVEEYNDNRTIVEINNNVYVESPDYDRIVLEDDEVYYEELRGGRVREVIERRNGTRVITVRNRYGDVIRRVRVTPDGYEHVLVYVPEDRFDAVMQFEDPALGLPPLELTIPVSEYILEADTVDDPDRYYTFLEQPPVEPVQRLYSLEEVKYSARVRDMVRRIDLDTIEFEFGSASIAESEIADLEAVANAILRILDDNPAETFLIEGHTDAVGSETANLALSDRRAEAVARALTTVFDVPPENLVTQGYGEQYLKIETQEPERENRRVAIRRITPLVSPVASRQ